MKSYPLDIENIGGDRYALMSRGHHDPHEFMRKVREEGYSWPLGMPRHLHFRVVPDSTGEHTFLYVEAKPGKPGVFPATYVDEAYHDQRYEALTAVTSEGD